MDSIQSWGRGLQLITMTSIGNQLFIQNDIVFVVVATAVVLQCSNTTPFEATNKKSKFRHMPITHVQFKCKCVFPSLP